MELTIAKHCVASDPQTKLSPLQQALIDAPQRVRIADAPTGAGKSYAFQKVLLDGARVLFIVPTRRLAQNLAAGLIGDLVKAGWSTADAEAKVEIWSSDQTSRLKELNPDIRVGGYRIRQLQALDDTRKGGEMIVAVPEVVSHLLLQRRMEQGQAAAGIFDLLDYFDHVVFDEFHTIDARGFGLAALCARLVSVVTQEGECFGRAKVSLLSATPLDIRPVLRKLDVNDDEITQLRETVTDTGRPLHGDVMLRFRQAPSLSALVGEHKQTIATEVDDNRQVVIIYNSLGDLRRELNDLAASFKSVGIAPNQVLVINSIDDSGRDGITGAGFQAGRRQDPDRYDVLVATASVEMGVTFRDANVMFMEPGFAPMNFLQRYGRAARRGKDGQVWVRWEKSMQRGQPWLRDLLSWAERHRDQTVGIDALTEVLSRSTRARFDRLDEDQARFFGRLPNRAVYAAGLYWNALVKHKANSGPRKQHLLAHQPQSSRTIYSWLRQVRTMESDRQFGEFAKTWCDRFEKQAYTLRDIGARLRVVEADGRTLDVDPVWLQRETDILERLPLHTNTEGRDEIRLNGTLDDYFLDERKRVQRMVTVYFPHTPQTARLPADDRLVDSWCRNLKGNSGPEGLAWEDYPEAMAAAEKLVRFTGLVPSDDDSFSMAASSGFL